MSGYRLFNIYFQGLTIVRLPVIKHLFSGINNCPVTGCENGGTCDEESKKCNCPEDYIGESCAMRVKDMGSDDGYYNHYMYDYLYFDTVRVRPAEYLYL